MAPHHEADELAALREQVDGPRTQRAKIEVEAAAARHETVAAHRIVLDLRDQVTAAERGERQPSGPTSRASGIPRSLPP
jgi:hypothetical protein